MNLLDTHALVWAVNAPRRLSPTARRIIEEGAVMVSAASLWEMLLKKGHPKKKGTRKMRSYPIPRAGDGSTSSAAA
jgi:PIN domain nuclease of toxin-antitoxin system